MKNLKNLVASFGMFILVLNTAFANEADPASVKKTEVNQIQSMLKSIDYGKFLEKETKLNISFFVNDQSEIIIVSTNNENLDSVIKSTLNYRKISLDKLAFNKVYTVPVVIK
jgi:hypothetical protein